MLMLLTIPPLLLALLHCSLAFSPHTRTLQQRPSLTQRHAVVEWLDAMMAHGLHDETLPTLLSTLYTTAVDLTPAHGHSNPLFGPPDPYLAAGRSIAPTTAGVEPASTPDWAPAVQAALAKGWKVLDGTNLHQEPVLPGFAPTRGFLPSHEANVPEETPATFAAQVEWAARFLNVIDKLPYAALAYGMVEFFLLRPNVDRYREDIEAEPMRAAMETAVVTSVRVGVFLVIAIVTTGIFG